MNAFRFHIATLGCKINQYESQSLREAWTALGGEETADPALAECVLVNSCAVTARAVSDLRQTVRRLHRANPDAAIVVTGCAAQVMAGELAGLPGVVEVVPQERKTGLLAGPAAVRPASSADAAAIAPDFAVSGYGRARAVVKVQDGCSHRCTYCIVPLTRGPARSRDPRRVLAETRALLDAGFREIVLSGINLRQFGPDLAAADLPPGWRGPADFWALLSWLDAELGPQWAGRARLRVSSVDPGQFMGHAAERALEALTAGTLFCPHLHLSIQSGSPAVLRRMGRAHYGPEDILAFVRALGARVPLLGLGADILTAFPGETEEHHAETVALARELPLTYAHVFPYSRRPGTPAARLDGQLPRQVKKQRSAELRELVAEKKRAFLARVAAEAATVRVALQCGGEDEADHADGSGTPRGVSEHYVACRFIAPPVGAANRALVAARPVRAGEGYLEVIPQDGPDAAPRTPPEAP